MSRMISLAVSALFAAAVMIGCDREPAGELEKDVSHRGGSDTAAWKVSPTATGPVRIGMSADEAERALGTRPSPEAMNPCYYIRPGDGPWGVMFMVVDGHVVRADVQSRSVSTIEGAHVGDSEERIMELYKGHVRSMPHKYEAGNYLIVTPDEGKYRIIFETDGKKVTRYRAGLLPAVEWVEGCS